MIGNRILLFPELESTNNYAATLLRDDNSAFGTVIMAEKQTSGRGQHGKSWISDSFGQFLGSFVIDIRFLKHEKLFIFNMSCALAARSCISSFLPKETVSIKWPNDILVNDKKIAGILIEIQWKEGNCFGAVLGLGVNLMAEKVETSISFEELGIKLDRLSFLEKLILTLEIELNKNKLVEKEVIVIEYENYLWRKNESQFVLLNGEKEKVTIVGVSDNGNLKIQMKDQIKEFRNQEISFDLNA